MADTKATALSAFTPVLTDILYGVDDPGGTPVSGKVTLTSLRDLLQANFTALTIDSQVTLDSDAANTLALRNSTNAQAINVYNTYTDASNYEVGFLKWSSNVLDIGTSAAGTGSNRNVNITSPSEVRISVGGSARLRMDGSKLFPATAGAYAIGTTALPFTDIFLRPSASLTPTSNGDLCIEATNNTTLTFKYKGSDGTVRSGTVTLS